MRLTSPSFSEGGLIPRLYTCDGQDTSPALHWEDVPNDARSLALIVDDPDAPGRTWVHWVLFNISPALTMLAEGAAATPGATGGAAGTNSWKRAAYGGPCPPSGAHRYYFKLYALDAVLDLPETTTAAQLETAMQGHVLATAKLMGRYSR